MAAIIAYHLDGNWIDLYLNGFTETTLHDGKKIPAYPEDSEYQRANAEALGYQCRFVASREHEVGHLLLAHLLGLRESPTFRGIADKNTYEHYRKEEAAVLALQAYARAAGIDLVERLKHFSYREVVKDAPRAESEPRDQFERGDPGHPDNEMGM